MTCCSSVKFIVALSPSDQYSQNKPRMNMKSPTRFVTKAFLPATALAVSENQKPMSR